MAGLYIVFVHPGKLNWRENFGFFQCMQLAKARQLVVDHLKEDVIGTEPVHLENALGRILAEDILAVEDLPQFGRSTVDGYALRSVDTFGAGETAPALLTIIGEIIMGEQAGVDLLPGQTAAIPTGGMLPEGADAVVMLEYTELLDEKALLISRMTAPGENVITAGEDIQAGQCVIKAGQRLAPQHIAALAACGCINIRVRKKIKVAIISTGDELVDADQPIKAGQVRDINSHVLAALLREYGCSVERFGIVRDNYEYFFGTISKAAKDYQLIVVSGGSSVGARDYTVKAIEKLGPPGLLLHGLAVKPGKPTIFGMIDEVPVFGLPGHPVAAIIVCEQLVRTAVIKLLGQNRVEKFVIQAYLDRNIASAPGRDDFVSVCISTKAGRNQEYCDSATGQVRSNQLNSKSRWYYAYTGRKERSI